jgi:hypothetical protein
VSADQLELFPMTPEDLLALIPPDALMAIVTLAKQPTEEERKLTELERLAVELMEEHGLLPRWQFRWSHTYRLAGSCQYLATRRSPGRTIAISQPYALVNDREFFRETMLHEIAHVLVGPGHWHDAVWKETARRIGSTGERCVAPNAVRPIRELAWLTRRRKRG